MPAVYSGIDIIEIERVVRAFRRRPGLFLRRFFTSAEQAELSLRKYKNSSLAGRFAAKEAVLKLLGLGLGTVPWIEIEVLHLPSGKPFVRLSGKAAVEAARLGINEVSLSISHNRQYAIAQAVAVKENLVI